MRVHVLTGDKQGKELDYTLIAKGKQFVCLFVRSGEFDRPMARYLKALDKRIGEQGADAVVVAVWIAGDQDKLQDYLPRVHQSLQLQRTVLCRPAGDANTIEGWSLNDDARLTAVVIERGKVVKSMGYISVNETDVEELLKGLDKGVGADERRNH